jgi:imidazolonepropionase-like amidohydrolase
MHRAGVRFVGGRDAGLAPHMAHGTLRDSIAFLAGAGATTAEALAAGTSAAAEACGPGDRKGRLRAGFDADRAVVDGDLESDLGCLSSVRAVFLAGHQVI